MLLKFRQICDEIFYVDQTLKILINKLYGIGWTTAIYAEQRFECFIKNTPNMYQYTYSGVFILFFKYLFTNNINPLKKKQLNILLLDLLFTYRGWRHLRGFPVNGQRTRSNAITTYNSNLLLRKLRTLTAKRIYGNIATKTINIAVLAEQVNAMWKVQWSQEWRAARKQRLRFLRKQVNQKLTYTVDLDSAAKGIIGNYSQRKNKARQKKKKMQKNTFMVGFDVGFARAVLKKINLKRKKLRP